MIDWQSTEALQAGLMAEQGSLVGQFAILIYELLNTLWFEWKLITLQIKFHPTHILLLMARWLLIPSYILGILPLYPATYSDSTCNNMFRWEIILIGFANIPATGIFALRVYALYDHGRFLKYGVRALIVGGWLGWIVLWMVIGSTATKAINSPAARGCAVIWVTPNIYAIFVYSVCYDFVIMALLCYRLSPLCDRKSLVSPGTTPRFSTLLVRQGLAYYICSTLASLWAMGWYVSKTNSVMENFGGNIDGLVACICASKASLSLIRRSIEGRSSLGSGSRENILRNQSTSVIPSNYSRPSLTHIPNPDNSNILYRQNRTVDVGGIEEHEMKLPTPSISSVNGTSFRQHTSTDGGRMA